MDLKLSNYSTTAAMNGSIASANNATLATVAANYGLKTVVDQHSLDIAARITPLEVDTKVANALLGAVTAAALASELQRRLHLGAAGLQGGRQRADRVRPILVSTSSGSPSTVESREASALASALPRRAASRAAVVTAFSKCPAGSRHRGLRRSAAC